MGSNKFRTMKVGKEETTKFGCFCRCFCLDEFPQLVNILKGEMTFVGPRPYKITTYGLPDEYQGKKVNLDELLPECKEFSTRLSTTPGLTSLARVRLLKHASLDLLLCLYALLQSQGMPKNEKREADSDNCC